jgi:hypothetical protein
MIKVKSFSEKNKRIIIMIPRIIILMLFTAYLSGFTKTSYDYVFVSVVIIVLGVFLFFVDIKKYLKHI